MKITILEERTEERPYFFEFKKNDVVGRHPTMPNLNYDPFPNAQMDDVVRREIIGRENVLTAKLKIDDRVAATREMRPGHAVDYGGHKFIIQTSTIEVGASVAVADIVATESLTKIDPMKRLAELRKMWAASNK